MYNQFMRVLREWKEAMRTTMYDPQVKAIKDAIKDTRTAASSERLTHSDK
jgi:hypothetical protein